MSIGTFAELKTAAANWLDRSDLSSRIPEFIVLFEAKVNRKLRVRQQQTTASITITSGSGTLPTDYLEYKRVTWQGDPTRELDYLSTSALAAINASQASAPPLYFTIEGSTIKVGPLDNTSLVIGYAQKVPALSDSATTNWLLTAHPDGYLFGTLAMSTTLTGDMTSGSLWGGLAKEFLGELWELEFASRGALVQRVTGPTP